MTNIHGIQPSAAAGSIQPTEALSRPAAPAQAAPLGDTVEISPAARLAAKVHEIPEIRAELVERVKAEIAAGTYETPERLDVAITRLMDDLLG